MRADRSSAFGLLYSLVIEHGFITSYVQCDEYGLLLSLIINTVTYLTEILRVVN